MLDSEKQRGFGADKFDRLPPACLECRYLRFCYGACPVNRVRTLPDGRDDTSYLCERYKAFFARSLPVFRAMARCLEQRIPPAEYRRFMSPAKPGPHAAPEPSRNAPCPCGSGKKYKRCCGKT